MARRVWMLEEKYGLGWWKPVESFKTEDDAARAARVHNEIYGSVGQQFRVTAYVPERKRSRSGR